MLLPTTPPFRRRRGRPTRRPPGAGALTLVAAVIVDDDGPGVRLDFDRPIDVSGLDASQVTVQDTGGTGVAYVGTGAVDTPAPNAVVVGLAETGVAAGPTRMTATAATGIVAVDDGGTWAGVTDLGLPFP